jgi:hypothetical protein
MYIGIIFYEIINYIRTSFEELLELNEDKIERNEKINSRQ